MRHVCVCCILNEKRTRDNFLRNSVEHMDMFSASLHQELTF